MNSVHHSEKDTSVDLLGKVPFAVSLWSGIIMFFFTTSLLAGGFFFLMPVTYAGKITFVLTKKENVVHAKQDMIIEAVLLKDSTQVRAGQVIALYKKAAPGNLYVHKGSGECHSSRSLQVVEQPGQDSHIFALLAEVDGKAFLNDACLVGNIILAGKPVCAVVNERSSPLFGVMELKPTDIHSVKAGQMVHVKLALPSQGGNREILGRVATIVRRPINGGSIGKAEVIVAFPSYYSEFMKELGDDTSMNASIARIHVGQERILTKFLKTLTIK